MCVCPLLGDRSEMSVVMQSGVGMDGPGSGCPAAGGVSVPERWFFLRNKDLKTTCCPYIRSSLLPAGVSILPPYGVSVVARVPVSRWNTPLSSSK